jgi:hypothetical protein
MKTLDGMLSVPWIATRAANWRSRRVARTASPTEGDALGASLADGAAAGVVAVANGVGWDGEQPMATALKTATSAIARIPKLACLRVRMERLLGREFLAAAMTL